MISFFFWMIYTAKNLYLRCFYSWQLTVTVLINKNSKSAVDSRKLECSEVKKKQIENNFQFRKLFDWQKIFKSKVQSVITGKKIKVSFVPPKTKLTQLIICTMSIYLIWINHAEHLFSSSPSKKKKKNTGINLTLSTSFDGSSSVR